MFTMTSGVASPNLARSGFFALLYFINVISCIVLEYQALGICTIQFKHTLKNNDKWHIFSSSVSLSAKYFE